jgi:predicted transcriptional regulator
MSDKKTALTVRIDDDLLQAFKKACDDLDYSQSLVIRELIKKWLADKKQHSLI